MGDVHGFPGDHEAFVTRAELAELMGVSTDTIDRMRDQGMPFETWGRRTVRIRPSLAMRWARQWGRM